MPKEDRPPAPGPLSARMRSTRWNRGREADLANTKKPHWHKSRESTVERRDTVLPPMLAPVMTVHPGRSSKSSEVNCSPRSARSSATWG